jgi:FlaA1/EpsC-like NDP-sugar epimerase
VSGKVTFTDVHQLDIYDLLGRDPVKPIEVLLNRNTFKKTVLVTGAGGSIGSELCRQLLSSKPKRLLLVDMSEFALYQIHQEIQNVLSSHKIPPEEGIDVIPLLASVCNEQRMHEIMDTWKPHTVFHVAAYKHVALVEHNPAEGVRNNVWGTMVCAEAAVQNGVQNFVLISTDKAVRPTNIMGASKRLSEMILQALNKKKPSTNLLSLNNVSARNRDGTCFSIVRFGNVLGSSGSVVPLFREQIKNGQAITLTHTEVTRYFMTITEAAQLVIQAGAMGTGGDVFVLDMGQPVRIYDLASRIVKLSGLTLKDDSNPQGDIEIKVTGLRPGEKLYEELLIGDNPQPTQHPRILKAQEKFIPWDQLQGLLHSLNLALSVNDVAEIREFLQKAVTEYQRSDEVVDWVYLEMERQSSKD